MSQTTTVTTPVMGNNLAYLNKQPVGMAGNTAFDPVANTNVFSQISLTPIAAPSIMGYYAFAVCAVILGTRWAQWYGVAASTVFLWPMFLSFGIMQILCAMFSYIARDNLATGFHGIWGSLWLSLGIYWYAVTRGFIALYNDGTVFAEFGIWFCVVGAITFAFIFGSFIQGLGTFLIMLFASAAALVSCISIFHGHIHILKGGGWLFFFAGLVAFYVASAWLIEYQFMRPLLPFYNMNLYNRFGWLNRGMLYDPALVNRGFGEPGVMKGQ